MTACIIFGLSGLLMGSFLNVCILRLPLGESVVSPRSHCRQCDHSIAGWDNIPLLSWVLLRAACRACGGRISWRYPAIELATCILFIICCLRFSVSWIAGFWAVLCFFLIGLAVMDAETLLLPDWFTLPGLVAGVGFAALLGGASAAGRSLLAALLAAVALLAVSGAYRLARRRMGMGLGDVKLLAMLAAWLGWRETVLVLFLAVTAGAVYGVGTILYNRRNVAHGPAMQLPVPFGTMLSLAGLYSIFLGERTLGWYLQFFH